MRGAVKETAARLFYRKDRAYASFTAGAEEVGMCCCRVSRICRASRSATRYIYSKPCLRVGRQKRLVGCLSGGW